MFLSVYHPSTNQIHTQQSIKICSDITGPVPLCCTAFCKSPRKSTDITASFNLSQLCIYKEKQQSKTITMALINNRQKHLQWH
jgi:hypothetical protein